MTTLSFTRPFDRSLHTRPTVMQMLAVWKQRRQLRTMDADTLSDIGLTRRDALAEAARPIWDVPAHWRC